MAGHPTRSSRLATVAMTLLSGTLLSRLLLAHHRSYVDVLLLTVLVLLAATTVKLHRGHCLEARMSAMALSLLCGASVVLTAVAGVPGQPHHPIGIGAIVTLALSSVVVGLLASDRGDRPSGAGLGSPYAS
jgi:peptidoglycan/LPS O-acetylase OafA/YrhL